MTKEASSTEQLFFLGYARIWAQNSFIDVFGINEKDSLFIHVDNKAKIW